MDMEANLTKRRKKTVTYVYDDKLARNTNKISNIRNRATTVHELIKSYGLTDRMNWIASQPATFEDLKVFHSSSYVDFLAACDDKTTDNDKEDTILNNDQDSELDISEEEIDVNVDSQEFQNEFQLTHADFGFGYDCPIFKNMGEFARSIAGGTLTACRQIMNGTRVAINWCGGWHHAQRDEAGGFCIVNDIVLGCHALQKKYPKILYIDLDAHHGDGVENAFSLTPSIFTLSFHTYERGFYPGTGSVEDLGTGKGKYYTTNVPLKSHINDTQFYHVFNEVLSRVEQVFSAHAIVVQCGTDNLAGDPLGSGNLTEKGLGLCVSRILKLNLPTLFLGGGGYNHVNSAKCWTYLTSIITETTIGSDIPEHDNFLLYGPDFDLSITPSPARSENTKEYLENVISQIKRNLEKLSLIDGPASDAL